MAKTVKIKQVRSTIKKPQRQKDIMKALGLRKINQVVEHEDSPSLRGMISRIEHLVEIQS
jgi:large subunit ribosomal protein L30